MEEVDLELGEEEVPPGEFVRELYQIAAKRHHRGTGGIYPSDLLYDMIPMDTVWWMAQSHPIALMLAENDLPEEGILATPMGSVIIYSNELVKECRDCLIELCHKYDLRVLEEAKFELVVDGK